MSSSPQDADTLERGGYSDLESLKLVTPLSHFPARVLDHAQTLRRLDLSGTGLSSIPDAIGQMGCLQVAFFSNCRFKTFPVGLASCPSLEMVAFRNNGMKTVPENCFPKQLRWLILTNNSIRKLPSSIGRCDRLQKCMLAGNQLESLPDEMAECKRLGLLRLAANRIQVIPQWLFALPELAFLSLSGNPCCGSADSSEDNPTLPYAAWESIIVHEQLGEGVSGIIHRATWQGQDIAVKLFKGDITSDGTPLDEMKACIAAGQHPNLIDTFGKVVGHASQQGLVMQLVPPCYKVLGMPPSLQSCTRDCFAEGTDLTGAQALRVLHGIAAVAAHIHARNIAHGDLYAHNILVDQDGHAILGDFGAASVYSASSELAKHAGLMQNLEVLAFGHLIEDVMGLVKGWAGNMDNSDGWVKELCKLQGRCTASIIAERPSFGDVSLALAAMQ